MQLHDADEYLVDRADYGWRNYSGLEFSSTEEPQTQAGQDYHLYQPVVQYSQSNQTAWEWQYSAELPYQDHRFSTRFSLAPR